MIRKSGGRFSEKIMLDQNPSGAIAFILPRPQLYARRIRRESAARPAKVDRRTPAERRQSRERAAAARGRARDRPAKDLAMRRERRRTSSPRAETHSRR